MRISLLCLLMLISLSSASPTSLNLYADGPTVPPDVTSSSCCLPEGLVMFEVINQTTIDLELTDVVLIQADQWLGQGCSINNVTNTSLVSAFSKNMTFDGVDSIFRVLTITFSETESCSTFLYASDPNLQSLYAYGPTVPPQTQTLNYCLPRGLLTYVAIGQTTQGPTTADIVLIQADQWDGPGCAINNMTNSSFLLALNFNITYEPYATRLLMFELPDGEICDTFLYDSPLNSLDLYSVGPTIPTDLSSSTCCLPSGPVTLVIVTQQIVNSTPNDIGFVQADQWMGPGCDENSISGFNIMLAWSNNVTPPIYPGNTNRWLNTANQEGATCSSRLYDSNPDPFPGFDIASEVLACISILACLWLFYRYYKSPIKPFSVQLILVLSVSDFFYHIFSLLLYNVPFDTISGELFVALGGDFVLYFSIFWSTTISIILMKVFSNSGIFKQVNVRTWILFLLPSLVIAACPMIVDIDFPSEVVALVEISFLVLTPVIITIGCYIRTIRAIRNHPSRIIPKYHALLLYPAVQLVLSITTALPSIFIEDPNMSFNTKMVLVGIISPFPRGLMGLANAAIYLFQNRKRTYVSEPKEKDDSSESPLAI